MLELRSYRWTIRFPLLLAGLAAVVMTLSAPLSASAGEWRLMKASGDVRVHGGDQWVKARAGQVLEPGVSVWAGVASRALIATEDGSVLLKSRSLVKIPSSTLPDGMTVLFHGGGEVDAKVDKKKDRHFSIQTPFLAAVVKGTEFTVRTDRKASRLEVVEGTVSAVDTRTGEAVDVTGGQSLTVVRAGEQGFANGRGRNNGTRSELGNDDDPDNQRAYSRSRNASGARQRGNSATYKGPSGDTAGPSRTGGNRGIGLGNGGGNGTDPERNNKR